MKQDKHITFTGIRTTSDGWGYSQPFSIYVIMNQAIIA
jgi:hypothetical protein